MVSKKLFTRVKKSFNPARVRLFCVDKVLNETKIVVFVRSIRMKGLMLDTPESGSCTRAQAFAKNLIPQSTVTYKAVPNEELLLMLNDAAREHSLILTGESLGMDCKGNRLFGTYQIENMDFFGGRAKLMMGFCNSYNKSLRIRVCFGGKVFVCSNMCFSHWTDEETGIGGEAGHCHTTNVNKGLWGRLKDALNTIDVFRASQDRFYTTLADRMLSQDEAYSAIIRAGKDNVVNSTRILDVVKEWDSQDRFPDSEVENENWHPEFKRRNCFNLLNAFTEVEKKRLERNPVTSNLGTLNLTNFFHREFIMN